MSVRYNTSSDIAGGSSQLCATFSRADNPPERALRPTCPQKGQPEVVYTPPLISRDIIPNGCLCPTHYVFTSQPRPTRRRISFVRMYPGRRNRLSILRRGEQDAFEDDGESQSRGRLAERSGGEQEALARSKDGGSNKDRISLRVSSKSKGNV